MTLHNRLRLAKLRWFLPRHKYAALLAGHRVTHELSVTLPIPFVGHLVLVRTTDAKIQMPPADPGRLAERVSEGAKQK